MYNCCLACGLQRMLPEPWQEALWIRTFSFSERGSVAFKTSAPNEVPRHFTKQTAPFQFQHPYCINLLYS